MDCNPGEDHGAYRRSLCEPRSHQCMQPVEDNASYALAANDFAFTVEGRRFG